jgi:hypothetical protein
LDPDELGVRFPDQSYVRGPGERAGAVCVLSRIVVSRRVHDWDVSLGQAREFLQQEALSLERESLPVEQVARQENGVDPLGECARHRPAKGFARRLLKAAAHAIGAPGERGVEVDVSEVKETHRSRVKLP